MPEQHRPDYQPDHQPDPQPAGSPPGPPPEPATPAERVRGLARLIGQREVASWCAELLAGRVAHDDPDRPSLEWLGGAGTLYIEGRLQDGATFDYWPRVWGARGLLHVWPAPVDPAVAAAVVAALADPAWRVREMAAKVVARHEVGEAGDALLPCLSDQVPRVRAAAVRALGAVGEHEHTDAVLEALHDDEGAVRRAADRAVDLLERRLDLRIRSPAESDVCGVSGAEEETETSLPAPRASAAVAPGAA